jgi:hypothetical protein
LENFLTNLEVYNIDAYRFETPPFFKDFGAIFIFRYSLGVVRAFSAALTMVVASLFSIIINATATRVRTPFLVMRCFIEEAGASSPDVKVSLLNGIETNFCANKSNNSIAILSRRAIK